jgi:hypothetical protein
MTSHDEHDDDLEAEVIEGAEIETEQYEAEDDEDISPETEVRHVPDRAEESKSPPDAEQDESEDEASDTI